jgi:hypothetical protein
MGNSMMLLSLVGLGLAGCALGDGSSSRQTSATYKTPERSETYMTPEQSATLTTMPGDATTSTRMRNLSNTPLTSNTSLNDDSGPPAAVWPQQ